MIIEFRDITEDDPTVVHLADLRGITLGEIFDKDERLKKVVPFIMRTSLNDKQVSDWKSIAPGMNDRVKFSIRPGFGYGEAIAAIAAGTATTAQVTAVAGLAAAIVSIAVSIYSMFAAPPTAKSKSGARESASFAFDGIKNVYAPGSPIPVVYGESRVGGQVLMFYVDTNPDKKGQTMSTLIGLCEGEIECISDIKINGLLASEISSINTAIRLGTSSQAVIPGFERIKNTFFDGREISDPQVNTDPKLGLPPTYCATSQLVYRTQGNNVEAVILQVEAPEGMNSYGEKGTEYGNWVRYTIETKAIDDPSYTFVSTRTFVAKTTYPILDTSPVNFAAPGAYAIRLTLIDVMVGITHAKPTLYRYRIRLKNVTEFSGILGPLSGTALLGISAAATNQLHGGQPTITALVKGKKVRQYTSANSYVYGWTANPAWCIRDYMTNSVYGAGGYIRDDDVDIQSFIEFATLADSRAQICA